MNHYSPSLFPSHASACGHTHTHFQHTLTWKSEASSWSYNADLWETRSRINFPSEVRAHPHAGGIEVRVGDSSAGACMQAECHKRANEAAAWNLRLCCPPSPSDSPFPPESPCAVVDTRVHSPQNFSLSTAFSLPPHTLNMSEVCLQGVELFKADYFHKISSKKVAEIEWDLLQVLKWPPVISCFEEKKFLMITSCSICKKVSCW